MHCLVFTETDLYSLTKGKSYLAKQNGAVLPDMLSFWKKNAGQREENP